MSTDQQKPLTTTINGKPVYAGDRVWLHIDPPAAGVPNGVYVFQPTKKWKRKRKA
ncbi:hypothetical protein [Fibrisoma montanum]|uniref:hypothetical protein n=1 Tax=Fibrisoma montanum TaxID=2305895 RepID=UPI0013143779|nr:hypothetical protein [Fibrisoma montanum]